MAKRLQMIIQFPPRISSETIKRIQSKHDLLELEIKYDKFLQKNQQLLALHDLIEEYLDIRDAITIKRQRIEREEQKRMYMEKLMTYSPEPEKCEYNHSFQAMLPDTLKLTEEQMRQGYIPAPREPKEYKCGCLTLKYIPHCCCKRTAKTCKNPKCNEKLYQPIKMHYYCIDHIVLVEKKDQLENALTKIKKELVYIKRHSNSFDYDDYKNALTALKPRRMTRYPWKNI